jgi:hypothetical protein
MTKLGWIEDSGGRCGGVEVLERRFEKRRYDKGGGAILINGQAEE